MKAKKLISVCLLMLLISALTGCMSRVELKDLGIVSGLGIDKLEDGYRVTAQILNPAAIAGDGGAQLPVYSFSAEGQSIHEAYNKLDHIGSAALFLSHLNVIVIDEAFAEAGFAPLLNFSLRHAEIRPDMTIVVAKEESAQDILSVVSALDTIPAVQIDVSSMVASRTARLVSYNLYEVVDMVNMETINLVLNAVSIYHADQENENGRDKQNEQDDQGQNDHQNEKDKDHEGSKINNIQDITDPVQLRIEHLAVFNKDKLVGFMDTYEAQLYNLLMGESKRYAFVTKIEDDYYTSGRVTKSDVKIKTDLENNEATITMNFDLMVIENTYPMDLTNPENLAAMSEYFKKQLESDLTTFIKKVQTEWQTDIIGIGGKAYYHENKIWKEKSGYWQELFPETTINLEIELEIDSIGEIGNVTH